MAYHSTISALRLFLFLSLLSNSTLTFYVLTSGDCKPCEERVRLVSSLYPEDAFVKYDIVEKQNLERFNDISGIIDEEFIPFPLLGIFESGSLKVMVAGGLSSEAWRTVIEEDVEGVPFYVNDGTGRAELREIIEDTEKIVNLESLFTGIEV